VRPEKKLAVEELQGYLRENPCAIFTNYSKISSERLNTVRNELEKKNSRFQVVKNRLFRIAASGAGIEGISTLLKGQVGVVFTREDQSVDVLKYLVKFKKDNEVLGLLGGVLDGTVYDAKSLETISRLPNKDAMRARFVGVLQAPLSKFAQVMRARLLSLLYVINAVIEKRKEETTNAPGPEKSQQE
jgi:large subunit ribosomal protein L10